MAKSLLNNLLGRFGIRLDKAITKIVNNETFDKLSVMYKIVSYYTIGEDKILVSYIPTLDASIISSFNLDIVKIANKIKENENTSIGVTSVPISACITSYGRIHISKIKLYILNNNGKIYYSDTDSIVTDIKLPDDMVSSNEIGKLKLEHVIKKAIFISGKTYCFINKDQLINRAKGLKSSSLIYPDYVNLLNNIDVTRGSKTQSITNWEKGFTCFNSFGYIVFHILIKFSTKQY